MKRSIDTVALRRMGATCFDKRSLWRLDRSCAVLDEPLASWRFVQHGAKTDLAKAAEKITGGGGSPT